ncbi:MAG: hypothetical protein IPK19_30270 [Chloroflexi bacterium]|nr:hypothetical protein [Chloroflexota bacterium]
MGGDASRLISQIIGVALVSRLGRRDLHGYVVHHQGAGRAAHPRQAETIRIDAYEHGAVAYTDFLDLEAKPAAGAGD